MSAPSSPQVFQFSCDVAGALLLLDPVLLDRFDDAVRYALAIAIDPDGNSDLSSDFPDEPWSSVWSREAGPILRLCADGELFLDLLGMGGSFFAGIGTRLVRPAPAALLAEMHGRIRAPSGAVGLVEAGALFDGWAPGARPSGYQELSVVAGERGVDVQHLGPGGATVEAGAYWAANSPSILLSLGDPGRPCTPGWRGHPNIGRFGPEDVAASGTRPEVHNAIVKRIEDGTAYMAILVSGGVQSGYAEAPVGTRSIQSRQKVKIRLLAKQGGRWIAEFV